MTPGPRALSARRGGIGGGAALRAVAPYAVALRAVALRAVALRAVAHRALTPRAVTSRAAALRAVVVRAVDLRALCPRAFALRAVVLLAALVAGGAAAAADRLGVIAVGDPPGGPDAELAELTHQLRAACRDRVGGVEEVAAMRARLLGQGSGATLSELDRAYGGALAVYQNGDFESSARTLRAIVADLEGMPEGEEAYFQWTRCLLRLAHVEATLEAPREVEEALAKLARTEPTLQPDPDQYSPGFRRRFEEIKARVRALPRRRLQVVAEGRSGTVYVNGRAMGTTPATLTLPAGTYRVGGAAGTLHVPSFEVDLTAEDRTVVLDFALAEALRPNAGPGLALSAGRRGYGIIRAGAWLGVDQLVVASRGAEGDAQFLLGAIYDVRRGALLREGSVRMVAGGVPSVNLGALAAFLLTGQSSREVRPRIDAPREIVPPIPVAAAPPLPGASATKPLATVAQPPRTPAIGPAPAPPSAQAAAARASSPGAPTPRASAVGASAPSAPTALASGGSTVASRQRAAAAPPAPSAAAPSRQPAGTTTSAAPAALAPGAPASSSPPGDLSATKHAPPPALPAALAASPASLPGGEALETQEARRAATTGRAAWARPWMRPAAIGAGVVAVGLAGLALQQALAASSAYGDANRMVGADGVVKPGLDPARYGELRGDGDRARRNALVSAGVAAAFAATAGALGWISWDAGPQAGVAVRF